MKSIYELPEELKAAEEDVALAKEAEQHRAAENRIRQFYKDVHPIPALGMAVRWLDEGGPEDCRTAALAIRDEILKQFRQQHPLSAHVASLMILKLTLPSTEEEVALPRQIVGFRDAPGMMAGKPMPTSYTPAAATIVERTTAMLRAETRGDDYYQARMNWNIYLDNLPIVGQGNRISRIDAAQASMAVCELHGKRGKTFEEAWNVQHSETSKIRTGDFSAIFPAAKPRPDVLRA